MRLFEVSRLPSPGFSIVTLCDLLSVVWAPLCTETLYEPPDSVQSESALPISRSKACCYRQGCKRIIALGLPAQQCCSDNNYLFCACGG